jgi:hypothetical protein
VEEQELVSDHRRELQTDQKSCREDAGQVQDDPDTLVPGLIVDRVAWDGFLQK